MSDVVSADDSVLKPTDIQVIDGNSGGVEAVDPLSAANDFSRVQPRQVVSGVSRGIQQLGSPSIYSDAGNEQIVVAKDGVPNVLMGNQANFGEGFYVSKPGVDATKNDDASEWIFNSNQNILKVIDTGLTSVESDGSFESWTTVTHNLGFTPIVNSFLNNVNLGGITSSGNIPLPTWGSASLDSANHVVLFSIWLTAISDSTNVYFQMLNATGSVVKPLPIKYYLLQESAN